MSEQRKSVVIYIFQEDLTLEEQKSCISEQYAHVKSFLSQHGNTEVDEQYYQVAKKQKNRNRWSDVGKAFVYAQEHKCDVIFANIAQYHGQSELGEMFLKFFSKNKGLKLHCIDQKFINENNICEIVKHFLQRRRKHGELIKQGLEKSGAKSGNPRASTVIAKVNRPKILCSVTYALVFEPVVSYFESKKLPQRKIIEHLNGQGLCAPEGGKWVLSQFQKVLERVRVNRLAFAVGPNIEQMLQATSFDIIAQSLASQYSHLLSKNKVWNLDLVKTVHMRYLALKEILQLNKMFEKHKQLLEENSWERLSHSQICELLQTNETDEGSEHSTDIDEVTKELRHG